MSAKGIHQCYKIDSFLARLFSKASQIQFCLDLKYLFWASLKVTSVIWQVFPCGWKIDVDSHYSQLQVDINFPSQYLQIFAKNWPQNWNVLKFYTLPYQTNHWIHTPSKHANKRTEKPSVRTHTIKYLWYMGTVKCKAPKWSCSNWSIPKRS